jgi:drug/metabolite transporter (DMT)-like permease
MAPARRARPAGGNHRDSPATPRSTMFELLPWCFAVSAVMLAPLVIWHAPHGGIGTHPMSWVALAYIGLIAGPFGTWCVIRRPRLPVVSSLGFLSTRQSA